MWSSLLSDDHREKPMLLITRHKLIQNLGSYKCPRKNQRAAKLYPSQAGDQATRILERCPKQLSGRAALEQAGYAMEQNESNVAL